MHRSVYMLMLSGACALSLGVASPSARAAEALVLRAQVTDADGRITLGDLFDNAGSAADVTLGTRNGPTAVLDAGRVQALAGQAGLSWPNPRGLRRIIVTAAGDHSANPAGQAAISGPAPRATAAPVVVKRNEIVRVDWRLNGIRLSMSGPAQKDGAVGDLIQIRNPQSKKIIEAVVTGPGTAAIGDEAQDLRAQSLYSSR